MTHTKGNVIVENIKVGDIHYEFDYNIGVKVEVTSIPVKDEKGWSWKAKRLSDNKEINYFISHDCPTYLSSNLYDYEAYEVRTWL